MPSLCRMLFAVGLLSFSTVDVAAQEQTGRFDTARAPRLAPSPLRLSFTAPPSPEHDSVSYSLRRIAFSTLGAAVGLVAGGLGGLALTDDPYGLGPVIGGALGSGTGASLGLLLPGGAPGPLVRSTVFGTALGALVAVAGDHATDGGGFIDVLWALSPLVGAHIGFSLAILR